MTFVINLWGYKTSRLLSFVLKIGPQSPVVLLWFSLCLDLEGKRSACPQLGSASCGIQAKRAPLPVVSAKASWEHSRIDSFL